MGGRCLLFGEGLDREQNLLDNPFRFGVRWAITRYAATLDEKFVQLDELKQNGAALQGYIAMDWVPNDYLTVTPSLGTHVTERRIGHPTYEPRLRVSFHPDGTEQQAVSLAVGKYNQMDQGITDKRDAGTVFTVWTPSSEDDPLPQALHGILGYRQRIRSALEVSVEGYVKNLQNIPVPEWTPEARFTTRTTLADGLAYGADARLELDTAPFYLFLGYGWSKVTYEAATDDLGAWTGGHPLPICAFARSAPPG